MLELEGFKATQRNAEISLSEEGWDMLQYGYTKE